MSDGQESTQIVSSKNGVGKSHSYQSCKKASWHFAHPVYHLEQIFLYIQMLKLKL